MKTKIILFAVAASISLGGTAFGSIPKEAITNIRTLVAPYKADIINFIQQEKPLISHVSEKLDQVASALEQGNLTDLGTLLNNETQVINRTGAQLVSLLVNNMDALKALVRANLENIPWDSIPGQAQGPLKHVALFASQHADKLDTVKALLQRHQGNLMLDQNRVGMFIAGLQEIAPSPQYAMLQNLIRDIYAEANGAVDEIQAINVNTISEGLNQLEKFGTRSFKILPVLAALKVINTLTTNTFISVEKVFEFILAINQALPARYQMNPIEADAINLVQASAALTHSSLQELTLQIREIITGQSSADQMGQLEAIKAQALQEADMSDDAVMNTLGNVQ